MVAWRGWKVGGRVRDLTRTGDFRLDAAELLLVDIGPAAAYREVRSPAFSGGGGYEKSGSSLSE